MPTDTVINRDFEDLFSSSSVRYEIPFFQRGYAWTPKQWKKLLDDIQEQVFEELEDENYSETEHFFGPVVVLEKGGAPHPHLKRYYVIDGQQRITTVYLMLALLRRELENHTHISDKAQQLHHHLTKLLVNDIKAEDDYLKLKVFSSKGDRLPTYYALFRKNPSTRFLGEDQQLYVQGENKVDQFVRYFEKKVRGLNVQQLEAYINAVTKSLKIVWIPLDEKKDDAQAIFESLNDAGMPLSAAELLCNFLFRPLTNEETNDHERLHNDKWLAAQKEVGTGNFEEYLRNLFSIGENKRVGKNRRMYVHFKNRNKGLDQERAMERLNHIHDSTQYYLQITAPIQHPHPNPKIKSILIDMLDTQVSAPLPFTMNVLMELDEGNLSAPIAEALLQDLYTLIIRRKVANLRTTKYDVFFPSLLEKIRYEASPVRAFQEAVRTEGLWVSDQEFEDAFLRKEIYNTRELRFTRHVLRKVDQALQSHGEYPDYSSMSTVEHVLPQNLDDKWKSYLGEDAAHPELGRVTSTLGNLCLNSQSANSSKGQKSFREKVDAYPQNCALNRDLSERQEPWNIAAIERRSRDLAKQAIKIWGWQPVKEGVL